MIKINIYLKLLFFIFVISGCTSTSLITTNQLTHKSKTPAKGIVYYLPKQLLQVDYKYGDSTPDSALAELQKQSNRQKNIATSISNAKTNIKILEAKIKKTTDEAALKKLKLELALFQTEKKYAESLKVSSDQDLKQASDNYQASLQNAGNFSESMTLTVLPITINTKQAYSAKIEHSSFSSDQMQLKTTPEGLLEGSVGYSDGELDTVFSSLASLYGLTSGGQATLMKKINRNVPQGRPPAQFSLIVDLDGETPFKEVREALSAVGSGLRIDTDYSVKYKDISNENELKENVSHSEVPFLKHIDGLVYARPGIVKIKICGANCESHRLVIAQAGQRGILHLPKGIFAKNDYDFSFKNSMLISSKTTYGNEITGFLGMFPAAVKAMFSSVTDFIQFRINIGSNEKELLELEKSLIEAEIALKQAKEDTIQ
jgi:hypothetical protein